MIEDWKQAMCGDETKEHQLDLKEQQRCWKHTSSKLSPGHSHATANHGLGHNHV